MKLEGHKRVSIENVSPELDCGKTILKRVIGEKIIIKADIFGDGHDKVDALLLYRKITREEENKWQEKKMDFHGNDHWTSSFSGENPATYEFTLEAWIDHFSTWQDGLKKKYEAGQNVRTELLIGAEMMEETIPRADNTQKNELENLIDLLYHDKNEAQVVSQVLNETTSKLMYQTRDRNKASRYEKLLAVRVERTRALFSAWYEFFPRSASPVEEKHGTFKDCETILPEIAKMGFNVIYLPPIHPIGKSNRKGINNSPEAEPGDPGSPWAIGSEEGGHKAIHPELGTMEDFQSLVKKAEKMNLEIALDFAIQCSQDHPYVKEHPQWFKWRPDGTVQYAENPPKKYQDVLPVNFETEDWENLWKELKSIVEFWIEKGVRIFRVDNPHTKSFIFWEWLIADINSNYEGIIFLAEAFTRPRVMEKLAKIGFTQSYTYFTWRNSKEEFIEYLTELTKTKMREYFRPNFWPNTPDILPVSLENRKEPSFLIRIILAATLSSNYGIYGPLFEFGLNEAYPGKEEYIYSEKYEIKHWNWARPTKIKDTITKLNQIRNENPALQSTWNLEFHDTDNDQILCYTKTEKEKENNLILVVSLDPNHSQTGWVKIPLRDLGIAGEESFTVHDLLTGAKYVWQKEWNYVALHPQAIPAHIFRIEPLNT